jgi:hypothetical protein
LKGALGLVLIIVGGAVSVQAITAPGAAWAELLREWSDVNDDGYATVQQMVRHAQARDEAAFLDANAQTAAVVEQWLVWLRTHPPYACYEEAHAALIVAYEAEAERSRAFADWRADVADQNLEARADLHSDRVWALLGDLERAVAGTRC